MVAVARKLAVILRAMWASGEPFDAENRPGTVAAG